MYAVILHDCMKNEVSVLINGLVSRPPFVRQLGMCNPICVKLLQIMSGAIPRNLKKNDVSILNRFPDVQKRGILTQTETHTQTHTHIQTHRHTRR